MKKIFLMIGMLLGINGFSDKNINKDNVKIKQSVIATTYTYPDGKNSFWNDILILGKEKVPYVLINPNNGAGKKVEVNYAAQIKKNKEAGIKNIAYIPTTYQKRNIKEIKVEVDKYFEFYGADSINGFFFDEIATSTPQQVSYMKEVFEYVKSKSKNNLVIANPGASITDTISPYADIFVTSEVSANTYINKFEKPKSNFENNQSNAKHIWHIVHSATPKEYAEIVSLSRQRNAGWLMITDDIMPNPYDKKPSKFIEMVNMINN